jgi:two-component system, OmpR family, sensor histidine kinase ArlS
MKLTLKKRAAVSISLTYSFIFGVTSIIIWLLFASYRQDEFKIRLEEKALTTVRLLVEVNEINDQLLKTIEKSTLNRLYKEKTVIYNQTGQAIYSTSPDTAKTWNKTPLFKLLPNTDMFQSQGEFDIYGFHYQKNEKNYFALVIAEDKYGYRKLRYLGVLLISAFALSTIIVWLLTFAAMQGLLKPLDKFITEITSIGDRNLTTRLALSKRNDEIDQLGKAFNLMMERIESSYSRQQEFSAQASHELRTPLARIITQLENLEVGETHSERTREYLRNLRSDAHQMADLIHSLLLLAQSANDQRFTNIRRMDELLFDAFEQTKKFAPALQIRFEIDLEEGADKEPNLEVYCNEALLLQALINLLRNADLYSDDHIANVHLKQVSDNFLCLRISNTGQTLTPFESDTIFDAFTRGSNARRKQGSGLGLRITQRILQYHGAMIRYVAENNNLNVFEVLIPVHVPDAELNTSN